VTSGAGAAALACLDLLVMLGIPVENIWVTDIKGLVYEGRVEDMDEIKGVTPSRPTRGRSARSSRTPTSSSGCRPVASSRRRWWPRWRLRR
jgi:malic enzyme